MVELDTHFPWYGLKLCIHPYWIRGSLQKSIKNTRGFRGSSIPTPVSASPQLLFSALLHRMLFLSLNIFHLPSLQLRLCLRILRFFCKYFIGGYFNEFLARPASSLRLVNPQIHARQRSQKVKDEGDFGKHDYNVCPDLVIGRFLWSCILRKSLMRAQLTQGKESSSCQALIMWKRAFAEACSRY